MDRRRFIASSTLMASQLGIPVLAAAAGREGEAASGTGLTNEVASFVAGTRFADIPAEVNLLAKKSILDGLGLAIAGNATHLAEIVRRHLADLNLGPGPALVIGTKLSVAPRFAAFANGTYIHAEDYDDTQLAVAKDRVYGLLTHPTAPVLPAMLAMAQAKNASGQDALLAYQLGVEVACKVAEAINPRHYDTGFHSTGTIGTFGSAAAGARLLGLGREATARALSIAGSQAAGLRENFGTMTKPFHAGKAAENGVVAAQFAAYGWSATDRLLEAPRGFFRAAGGGYDASAIGGKLGNPWTFANPGISIKPHPSGSLTHPGMTEMMRLIKQHAIRAGDVVKVRVGTNHNMPNALIHHRPADSLQAKFSMEFCMAILLLEGRAGLPEFTDEVVNRPDVKALIQKVDFVVDERAEKAGYDKMTTYIDVTLKDGRTVSGMADFGRGSPAFPMSYDEVAEKFRENTAFAKHPKAKSEEIIAVTRELESIKSIERLASLLSP